MNWSAAGWVTYHCQGTYTAAKVLGVIVGHVGIHSGDRTAHPSIPTIAKLVNVDEKTVRRSLKSLAVSDGLTWVTNGGPHNPQGQRSNLYTVPERFSWTVIQAAMRSKGDIMSVSDTPHSEGDIMPTEVVMSNGSQSLEIDTTGTKNTWGDIMSGSQVEHRQSDGRGKRRRRTGSKPEPETVAPDPVREPSVCAYESCQQMTTSGYCSSDCTLSAEIPSWARGWHDRHRGQTETTSETGGSLSLRERMEVLRQQRHSELQSVG